MFENPFTNEIARRAARPKPVEGILRTLPSLHLSDEIGNNRTNDEDDLFGMQEQLAALGYLPERYAAEPDRYITKDIEDGIRRFQSDHDLKTDGWVKPKGETVNAINKRVSAELKDRYTRVKDWINPSQEQVSYPPVINDEKERKKSILKNTPAHLISKPT